MAYTAEQRQEAITAVLEGLSQGTPLTVILAAEGMPGYTTFWEWQQGDSVLSEAIARAREAGWDAIAVDALKIADHTADDTVLTEHGEKPNTEWITRSRLRVDTRLKLLAKWDPKRYGDRSLIGSDPENPLPAGFTVNLVKPVGNG